ncbi:hypothetical protein CRG98_029950 [Punica granatum]|uniref:Uncharacterized protein n=1 Tax=Punica granatum TaxID=22663 RepID=A0A2I0J0E8_PUNGR|nr:hypothetical protein CRG98_029950 [Punica granatum]
MKEHELSEISIQWEANWLGRRRASMLREMHKVRRGCVHWQGGGVLVQRGNARSIMLVDTLGQVERCALDHTLMLSVKKKLVLVNLAWEGGSALGPRLALSWRKGEDHRWSTRKSLHESLVMWVRVAAVQT